MLSDLQNASVHAQTVYNVSPRALIITFGAESFDYCETLTPRAEAALPEVLQHVLERIPKYSQAAELFGEPH